MLAAPSLAARYYVDADAQGAGNGSSWADAWTDLQTALTYQYLSATDVIWVADGTHKPTGSSTRTVSFEMVDGVKIYGGFIAVEGYLEDRDVHGNAPTILSGDIDASGGDDTFHVVASYSNTAATRLDGFTITKGNADGDGPYQPLGGGLRAGCSSLAIVNCTFVENMAGDYYVDGLPFATPGYGGALYSHSVEADCSTLCPGSVLNVIDCEFRDNVAIVGYGGGVFNDGDMNLINTLFADNAATQERWWDENNQIWWYFDGHGGAIANEGDPAIQNCTIADNTASSACAGFDNHGKGGGVYNTSSCAQATIINSILWGNQDGSNNNPGDPATLAAQVTSENGATCVITYSDVQCITSGTGNINADPLFVNTVTGDYHLGASSPARNVGYNTDVPADAFDVDDDDNTTEKTPDLDLSMRISNGTVDMGAYEHCDSDVNVDGVTDVLDLLLVLAAWGNTSGVEDINEDDIVYVLDLLLVLGEWGCGERNPGPAPDSIQDCIDTYGSDIEKMIGCIEAILKTEE